MNQLKSDRLKRRERREAIKENHCVNLGKDLEMCPIATKKKLYESRKTQKSGKDDKKIAKNGIEYDYDKISIRELFDDYGTAAKKESIFGQKKNRQSYIYIISKVIDGRTFFKIGYSDIANNAVVGVRLESHKTTLIPGLKNIGFKLHYLFFYDRLIYGGETSYAHLIEQELHKYLRNNKKYQSYIIHYPSSRPSEWYLPDNGKFEDFMDYVLYFISVQVPKPKQAYWFLRHRNKDKRLSMDDFFPVSTPEDIREFRHDFASEMAQVKITQKVEKSKTQMKKGSLTYFKDALLNVRENKPPLGSDIEIKDVVFYNKTTTSLLKSREYYVLLSSPTKPYSWLNQFIPILGKSELVGKEDDTYFVSHIGRVLEKMKEINTIDLYELRSNLNHYDGICIEEAKSRYMTVFEESVSIPKKDLSWLQGRYLKDKEQKVYKVEVLHTLSNNATKVDKATCVEVDETTLKERTPKVSIKGNIFTIIHLVIEYHDNNPPSLSLKDNYYTEMKHMNPHNTKFKLHDFIVIKEGYYKDPETSEPIMEKYDGLITNIEIKLWKKGENPALCYDILFEDGSEWFHLADSIDKNAKLKHKKNSRVYKKAQKEFLGSIKGPLQASAQHMMEILGYRSPEKNLMSSRRSTRKRRTKS